MLTYRISKKGTIILEKEGVYFGLTAKQVHEFLDILMKPDVIKILEASTKDTVVGDDLV